jgi:ABC-2 type transport system ATP-binding protein
MGGLVTTASSGRLAAFEGISKSYGSTRALDGITFSVPEGSVCGLLGPNGSGKTTALRILLGLTRPNEGESSLLGDTGGSSRREAARRTGALVETPALYERTSARGNMVIEAAARGLGDSSGEIQGLLDLVGLGSRADDRVKGFSLGMRQRLGLATALLGKPKLVILDEPTNGLDPAGIVEIRELIRTLPELGTTVLVSSHLLQEVQAMCDRVVILDHGRLVAEGAMSEILGDSRSAARWKVRIDPSETERATAALVEVGLGVVPGGDGILLVSGPVSDGSQLNVLLTGAGIYLSELVPEFPDLESVFLALTDSGDDRDES